MKPVGTAITVATLLAALASNRMCAESFTVATTPAGLTVTVDNTNYTAPVTFAWLVGSSHRLDIPSPQLSTDGHSRSNFVAWSDGGAQSHSILMPAADTTNTASFVTQYLLDTTVTPSGAGSITNAPGGSWYDAGQTVSLAAVTNTSYRFNFWLGADNAASNTAQVTMNGYRLVQASFIPSDFPYIVVTNNGSAAPGNFIGSIDGRTADGSKLYYVILDHTGTNVLFASKTNTLSRFVTPQGLDGVAGSGVFNLKDETLGIVDSFSTLGYILDNHDIKLLPNGHVLVFGTEVRTFDMSTVVPARF